VKKPRLESEMMPEVIDVDEDDNSKKCNNRRRELRDWSKSARDAGHSAASLPATSSGNCQEHAKWVWSRSCDLFKFWKIIDNMLELVQDRHSYMEDYRKSCMAYQMA